MKNRWLDLRYRYTDKVLKYCTTCKKVWGKYNYKGNTNFFFYYHFARYGKTKENCSNCK